MRPEVSVLQDVLGVYDHRYLQLDEDRRRRLMAATSHVIGDGLPEEDRDALPAAYRLRAFCIQRGLHEELERLIRDETEGRMEGAVVVGGRVYAMYPYLRGVPRHDADITDEVRVVHRLDAVAWTGCRLRVRGHAAIARVVSRDVRVELVLRGAARDHRVATTPCGDGFEGFVDGTDLDPGHWDAHVAVRTLGLTREAPFGAVRTPGLTTEAREHAGLTVFFTPEGSLAIFAPSAQGPSDGAAAEGAKKARRGWRRAFP
jgi:hypothetical protein